MLIAAALSPELRAEARSNILWRDCFDVFNCGTMRVPLDHTKPAAGDIHLALIRHQATDPENKIGSLLVNFGGPGGPGVAGLQDSIEDFPEALLERFDIIGFDPRGVGQSSAVDCVDNFDVFEDVDPSPDTPLEIDHAINSARELGRDCQRRSKALIQHVNTEAAARDMDLIREKLGDDKLTYLGFSYGTLLGATYAELFPERVRALVLDAGLDPALTPQEDVVQQSLGFELALESFFAHCEADPACPFKAPDIRAAYDRLLVDTDTAPLTGWSFPIGRDEIANATAGALYSREEGWLLLGEAMRQAVDEQAGVGFGALLSGDPDTNPYEAFLAIGCVDFWSFSGEGQWRAALAEASAAAPHFGKLGAYGALPCVFWPGAPRRTPGAYAATGAPPILVIGGLRDPATPYQWSVGLADGLESAVLLTYDGDGHTATGRSSCIDGYVEAYLLDLTVPEQSATCGNDYPPILEPTATPVGIEPHGDGPAGSIRPPDTGFGPERSGANSWLALLACSLLVTGGALAAAGRRAR